jgi:hypothetical protein
MSLTNLSTQEALNVNLPKSPTGKKATVTADEETSVALESKSYWLHFVCPIDLRISFVTGAVESETADCFYWPANVIFDKTFADPFTTVYFRNDVALETDAVHVVTGIY